jgi:hypothetical protein
MSAAAARMEHGRRERLLRVMGVTPWRLRGHEATAVEAPVAVVTAPAFGTDAVCVLVVPSGCTARQLDLIGRALLGFGPVLARAARIEVIDGAVSSVPLARAYLVFGEAQAHALGREMSAAVMSSAHIVLVDEPARILTEPAAKRRLWSGLRTLRRALLAATNS